MPQDLRTHLQLYLERLKRLGPRPPYGEGTEDGELFHWERERREILAIIGDLTIQWLGRQDVEMMKEERDWAMKQNAEGVEQIDHVDVTQENYERILRSIWPKGRKENP